MVPDDACIAEVRAVLLEGVVAAAREVATNGIRRLAVEEHQRVAAWLHLSGQRKRERQERAAARHQQNR
jgi:hypothetical protein